MALKRHLEWLAEGVERWNKRRELTYFIPNFRGANLRDFELRGINLRGAILSRACLSGCDLSHATLLGVDLHNADLRDATLDWVRVSGSTLLKADFRGASLVHTWFDRCDLRGANLSGTELTTTYFQEANLQSAKLYKATIRSGELENSDLAGAKGLSESQINSMDGDTGVILPDGFKHPTHWAIWERKSVDNEEAKEVEASSQHNNPGPVAFISYSNLDSTVASKLRDILISVGINCWWDKDLSPGTRWRRRIRERLESSEVIVTLWTESSVKSDAVIEEASFAQKEGKLVHAKLSDARLPYGFQETQYADLRGWDGDPAHSGLRILVQAIKDKIKPPSADEIDERLAAAAPLATVIEHGYVTAKDSPPNVPPAQPDQLDLEARLHAQEVQARKLLRALEVLDNNLGEGIRLEIGHYIEQVNSRPANWYTMSDSISDLRYYLDIADDISWPGNTKISLESLCRNHEILRPRIQPLQPVPGSPDAPLPPPLLNPSKVTTDVVDQLAAAAEEVFDDHTVAEIFDDSAVRAAKYLTVEISGSRLDAMSSIVAGERRLNKLRKSITSLAGFVGSSLKTIALGITINAFTSSEAARRVMAQLKSLYEILRGFFG